MRTETDDDTTPFIVLINEIDRDINDIHNGSVTLSQKLITPVINKTSFNDFLDEVTTIPRLILIFTSNWTEQEFNDLDPSYIRDGRVTFKRTLA
jgi:hypothetical protein